MHTQVITAEKSRRIAEYAFEYAVLNGRKRVTAIHKANIMKLSDGLFLRVRGSCLLHSCCKRPDRSSGVLATLQECQKVAQDFPTVEFNSMIVDNTCMQLTGRPDQFDVMVRIYKCPVVLDAPVRPGK
jgi:isocitrate dehydrogenase (NAD+)